MALVQSCIDNIGLLKKAASLFISLALVFPLGFWLGGNQQTVAWTERQLGKGIGAWKIHFCCFPRQETKAGSRDPLVGRELPLL